MEIFDYGEQESDEIFERYSKFFRLDSEENIDELRKLCKLCSISFLNTAIGIVPTKGSLNFEGIVNWEELMSLPLDYWKQDAIEVRKFFEEQVGPDLSPEVRTELEEKKSVLPIYNSRKMVEKFFD